MNNIIIITGHNNYATGMYSALMMISGNTKNIYAVDFLPNDTDKKLVEKFTKLIEANPNKGILFACDLLGGTPYKEAAKLSVNNPNIQVITGANLAGILDCNFKKETLNIKQLGENLKKSSEKNIMIFKNIKQQESGDENGI